MALHLVIPHRLLFVLSIGIVVVIAGALGYIYLPSANIVVEPAVTSRSIEQDIIISKATKEPDFIKFILPADALTKEIQETKTFTRTNTTVHEDFAKGQVTLVNKQIEKQALLPQTHLRHEATGTFFLTDTAVTIPPEGSITISITAKEKGSAGNVPAGKFIVDKLPTSLQSTVYGESTTPMSGGTAVEEPLTEDELSKAKQTVQDAAKEKALGELTIATGGAPIRKELLTVQVLSEDVSAAPGSLTSSYTVTTKIKASGFVVDDNDLLSLTLLALRSKQGQDEEFVAYDPQSFTLQITAADFERGEAKVKGKLSGTFAQKVEPGVLNTQNLSGLSVEEAKEHFKKFPSVENVQISLSPFWVKAIPARPEAVTVEIRQQTKKSAE